MNGSTTTNSAKAAVASSAALIGMYQRYFREGAGLTNTGAGNSLLRLGAGNEATAPLSDKRTFICTDTQQLLSVEITVKLHWRAVGRKPPACRSGLNPAARQWVTQLAGANNERRNSGSSWRINSTQGSSSSESSP